MFIYLLLYSQNFSQSYFTGRAQVNAGKDKGTNQGKIGKMIFKKLFPALIFNLPNSVYDRFMKKASIQYRKKVEEVIHYIFATCTNSGQLVHNHLQFYFYKTKK